jgi:trk system potassium uptake protein TrkA|tara:strand:+ start:3580 stop:4209 length:630 start_codon:yes stop_codon:yes gene_type:complete
LAKTLVEDKHEIAIIEKDKDLSQEISREMDVLVINGDGTQIKTLEGVNAKSADAFVASTRKDEMNLLSALVAKNMGVTTVISRVSNPENKEVFKKLGIDHVISPETTAAEYIGKIIRRPDAVDLAILGRRDVEILEFVVDNKSEVIDMAVKDLTPKGYLIIAVHKGSELVIPKGDTVIEEGDEVLVLSKSNSVGNVEKLFVVKENGKKD